MMVQKLYLHKEVDTFKSLHSTLGKEEDYWRLKSRNNWLKARDNNAKFFHKQPKFRESKNNITQITHGGRSLISSKKSKELQ